MNGFPTEARTIMQERFGHDTCIALATAKENRPSVRTVDGYYEEGAFYVITSLHSHKMQEISCNPQVAIAGEWFTAHGMAENLGYFCKEENQKIANKLRHAFASWIDNGHNDFSDQATIILCIHLTNGVLYSHGTCYELDFG